MEAAARFWHEFELGDLVEWVRRRGERDFGRRGYVVGVVPPHGLPMHYIAKGALGECANASLQFDAGAVRGRPELSYLVFVPGKRRGGSIYWPPAGKLRKVQRYELTWEVERG